MFLSNFESSVDVKKRVSIPALFRKSLGGQESVYLWESLDKPCIEGCGQALVDHFEASISDLDLMDRRRFALATVILGDMVQARLDDGGRIVLDAALMAKAGITDKAKIVGAGDRFQIWEPTRYEAMRARLSRKSPYTSSGYSPSRSFLNTPSCTPSFFQLTSSCGASCLTSPSVR